MANEPSYVDGGEAPGQQKDLLPLRTRFRRSGGNGGCRGGHRRSRDFVGTNILAGYDDSPAKPRYDVIYLLDDRGWFYRYSHLQTIDPAVRPGAQISMGQRSACWARKAAAAAGRICTLTSTSRQPSGLWGIQEGYAFCGKPTNANTRPNLSPWAGRIISFSPATKSSSTARKSWSASGKIARYDWTFTDGTTASSPTVARTYVQSGEYSEILKITDARGEVDYDFAVVLVIDKSRRTSCLRPSTGLCAHKEHPRGRSGDVQGAELSHDVRQ